MPIAVARALICRAAGMSPDLNCHNIQIPATISRADTTRRQKQCQRLSRAERLRLLNQPMIPATRKPTATITVTQAEAIIGKLSASTPNTIIMTPSAWVNPFSRPASRVRRSRAVEVSKGSL